MCTGAMKPLSLLLSLLEHGQHLPTNEHDPIAQPLLVTYKRLDTTALQAQIICGREYPVVDAVDELSGGQEMKEVLFNRLVLRDR